MRHKSYLSLFFYGQSHVFCDKMIKADTHEIRIRRPIIVFIKNYVYCYYFNYKTCTVWMQKDLSSVINCLSCYIYSCAWGTILGSRCIFTLSNCIRTFVQLYNCTILHCGYNRDTFPHSSFLYRCFSNENIHKQLMLINR